MAFSQTFIVVDKSQHDLKSFDCGKPAMNEFLARYAIKNMALGLSSTWVLPVESNEEDKSRIAAYYTLASTTLSRKVLPTDKKLPGYPVPVVLLARLAIDTEYQGMHLGEKTLVHALRHAVQLSQEGLPAFGLVLDVLDKDALTFYQRFNIFEALSDDPMRLFAGMNTLKQI